MERRFWDAEIRVDDGDNGPVLTGRAVPYNELSVMLWGFREEIQRGAFALDGDIAALWQHDMAAVLGRTVAETLEIWDDDQGIWFRCSTPDTQIGRDAVTSVRRGDVNSMSFGFHVLPDGSKWRKDEDDTLIRTITNGQLVEVSPVTWAAYPQTNVGVRSERMADGHTVSIHEVYGAIPEIPDSLRRALDGSIDDGATTRARAAQRRQRELSLLGRGR